jgi:type III secretion protein D
VVSQLLRQSTVQLLRDRALVELVSMETSDGHVRLHAQLSEAETLRLEGVLRALKQQYGQGVSVAAEVSPLSRDLPFKIREIVMGPASHITLTTGAVVYEGQAVDGVRLLAIKPGKLVFAGARRIEVAW